MRRRLRGQRVILTAVALGLALAASAALAALTVTYSISFALIAGAAAAATVGTLASIEIGILTIILVACFDGLLKGISPGWHTQFLKDYFLAVCLMRWIWLSVLGSRRRSVRHPMMPALFLFVAWCAIQMFNTRNYSLLLTLAGFRAWVIWIPLFALTYDYLQHRRQVDRLVLFIIFLLIPIGIYTVVQYNIGYEHLTRLGPGFSHYKRFSYTTEEWTSEMRPAATMVQPHNLAAAMSCAILLATGAIVYLSGRKFSQVTAVGGIAIYTVAMLMTGGRTAVAGTAVGIVVLLLLTRGLRVAVLVAAVFMIAATQVGGITQARALERIALLVTKRKQAMVRVILPIRNAVRYAGTHFLGSGVAAGTGAGRLIWRISGVGDRPQRLPWTENDFARALMELGVPGLLLHLWMLYSVIRALLAAYRKLQQPRDRWLATGMLAACAGVLTRLLAGPALYTWPQAIFFWIFVGVVLRLPAIEASEDAMRTTSMPASQARRSAGQ